MISGRSGGSDDTCTNRRSIRRGRQHCAADADQL